MYHQEKFIDGWIHWRSTPDGEWQRGTVEQQNDVLLKLYKTGMQHAANIVDDYADYDPTRDSRPIARDIRERVDSIDSLPSGWQ